MKHLIVSADDFGLTRGVNKAIIEAHERAILTSASLMVGGKAFEDAVNLAKGYPELGIGIHLTLVNGCPVSPPEQVPTLLKTDHSFYDSPMSLIARLVLGRVRIEDLARELGAQVKRALDAGVRVTHVDGHKHLHVYPGIFSIVIDVMREFGIKKMRLPLEWPHWIIRNPHSASSREALRHLLVSVASWSCRARLVEAEIAHPDHFFGLFHTGSMREHLLHAILRHLPLGTSEIMCHPGYDDQELRATGTRLGWQREMELKALTSEGTVDLVKRLGIRLINYGAIS